MRGYENFRTSWQRRGLNFLSQNVVGIHDGTNLYDQNRDRNMYLNNANVAPVN